MYIRIYQLIRESNNQIYDKFKGFLFEAFNVLNRKIGFHNNGILILDKFGIACRAFQFYRSIKGRFSCQTIINLHQLWKKHLQK